MGKGEIAHYEQFLLFPQCFQNAFFKEASKGVIVWEWVNPTPLPSEKEKKKILKLKLFQALQRLPCLSLDQENMERPYNSFRRQKIIIEIAGVRKLSD